MAYRFIPERWHLAGRKTVHTSAPDRDSWCGVEWGSRGQMGYPSGYVMCQRCRKLGEDTDYGRAG